MGEIARKTLDGWGNTLILYADETGTSTSGNYSSIHTYLDLYVVSGGSVNADNTRVNTTGGQESYLGNIRYGSGTHRLKDGYYNAPHNENGSGSTYVEGYFNSGLGNWALGGTLNLTQINRYPVLNNGSNFTDESNPVYNITSYNTYPIRVKLEAGGNSQLIIRDIPKNTNGNYTLELTETERNTLRALCPNSNTLNVRETVCAMSGNTELSASYKDYKMTIVNANPVFGNFEIQDTNTTTVNLTGSTLNNVINVNGYSNIKAIVSTSNKATSQKSATMSKYRFTIGDKSKDITYSSSSSVNGTINNSPNGVYNLYAIDSRGNSTLITKQATSVKDYTNIMFDKINCTITRNDNHVGENALLTFSGTFWNNNFGVVTNSIKSVTYRFKKTTSSTWTTGTTTITPTVSGNNFSVTNKQIASDNQSIWDLDSSYNIQVTISDKLSSSTVDLILNSATPTLSLDRNGVGVMCAYDSNIGGLLQVGGKIIDGGTMLWTNTSPTSNFNPQTITLSSDDYDMLLWLFKRQTDNMVILPCVISIKGYGCMALGINSSGETRRRGIDYINDTTYYIAGAGSPSGETNGAIIPLYVIGYKTNLFS